MYLENAELCMNDVLLRYFVMVEVDDAFDIVFAWTFKFDSNWKRSTHVVKNLFSMKDLRVKITDLLENDHGSITSIFGHLCEGRSLDHPIKNILKTELFWFVRPFIVEISLDKHEMNNFLFMFLRFFKKRFRNLFLFVNKFAVRLVQFDMFGLTISGGRISNVFMFLEASVVILFGGLGLIMFESVNIILLKVDLKIVLEGVEPHHCISWSFLHLYYIFMRKHIYILKYDLNPTKTTHPPTRTYKLPTISSFPLLSSPPSQPSHLTTLFEGTIFLNSYQKMGWDNKIWQSLAFQLEIKLTHRYSKGLEQIQGCPEL